MIKNAIIYKSGIDEIAIVLLYGKVHMSMMYGNDYSIQGLRFGHIQTYNITVKYNGVVVGCAQAEEYINEIWKGIPEI